MKHTGVLGFFLLYLPVYILYVCAEISRMCCCCFLHIYRLALICTCAYIYIIYPNHHCFTCFIRKSPTKGTGRRTPTPINAKKISAESEEKWVQPCTVIYHFTNYKNTLKLYVLSRFCFCIRVVHVIWKCLHWKQSETKICLEQNSVDLKQCSPYIILTHLHNIYRSHYKQKNTFYLGRPDSMWLFRFIFSEILY